jgi:hypothetical protein
MKRSTTSSSPTKRHRRRPIITKTDWPPCSGAFFLVERAALRNARERPQGSRRYGCTSFWIDHSSE